ncbi:uncharacterized protein MONOS_17539 [Monocercomonoides exilis]|uniref:uncharacterized protein n=1 Tax=Monocercomonoides exilis TaxID=2049356 RepID=UPI00355A8B09|nr:hypothetical protein MONOS_17539 [Monocercomonoides exilis]
MDYTTCLDLQKEFPSIEIEIIINIFTNNHFNKEKTLHDLEELLDDEVTINDQKSNSIKSCQIQSNKRTSQQFQKRSQKCTDSPFEITKTSLSNSYRTHKYFGKKHEHLIEKKEFKDNDYEKIDTKDLLSNSNSFLKSPSCCTNHNRKNTKPYEPSSLLKSENEFHPLSDTKPIEFSCSSKLLDSEDNSSKFKRNEVEDDKCTQKKKNAEYYIDEEEKEELELLSFYFEEMEMMENEEAERKTIEMLIREGIICSEGSRRRSAKKEVKEQIDVGLLFNQASEDRQQSDASAVVHSVHPPSFSHDGLKTSVKFSSEQPKQLCRSSTRRIWNVMESPTVVVKELSKQLHSSSLSEVHPASLSPSTSPSPSTSSSPSPSPSPTYFSHSPSPATSPSPLPYSSHLFLQASKAIREKQFATAAYFGELGRGEKEKEEAEEIDRWKELLLPALADAASQMFTASSSSTSTSSSTSSQIAKHPSSLSIDAAECPTRSEAKKEMCIDLHEVRAKDAAAAVSVILDLFASNGVAETRSNIRRRRRIANRRKSCSAKAQFDMSEHFILPDACHFVVGKGIHTKKKRRGSDSVLKSVVKKILNDARIPHEFGADGFFTIFPSSHFIFI